MCDQLLTEARDSLVRTAAPAALGLGLVGLSGCPLDGPPVLEYAAPDIEKLDDSLLDLPAVDTGQDAFAPPDVAYMGPDPGPQPEYMAPDSGPVPPYMAPDEGPQPEYMAPDPGPQPLYMAVDTGFSNPGPQAESMVPSGSGRRGR